MFNILYSHIKTVKLIFRYGMLTDCQIPLDKNGKKMGYGFVQFTHTFESERAKNGVNMTIIKDRKVAVDNAKAKEVFKKFEENEELDGDEAESDNKNDDTADEGQ